MGEPAEPTEAERTQRRALATAIVDSVRNDEDMPSPFAATETDQSNAVFGLAQELILLEAENDSLGNENERLRAELLALRAPT